MIFCGETQPSNCAVQRDSGTRSKIPLYISHVRIHAVKYLSAHRTFVYARSTHALLIKYVTPRCHEQATGWRSHNGSHATYRGTHGRGASVPAMRGALADEHPRRCCTHTLSQSLRLSHLLHPRAIGCRCSHYYRSCSGLLQITSLI